jgi:hypothetical protein
MILWAITAWMVSQAPAAPKTWDDVPGITPPLGSLNDSVSLLPSGGIPALERTEVVEFPGCPVKQVLWLQRFSGAAALAAYKISEWTQQNPLPSPLLKDPNLLLSVISNVRRAGAVKATACVELEGGWRISATSSKPKPKRKCSLEETAKTAWFVTPGKPPTAAAAVHFSMLRARPASGITPIFNLKSRRSFWAIFART